MACLNLTTLPPEIQTLVGLATFRASEQPGRLAYRFLRDGEGLAASLTYAELDQRARAIAALLQAHQLYQKPVLLLLPPGLDYICSLLGCLYAGAIAVPVSPSRRSSNVSRLKSILGNCKASMVLSNDAVWQKLQSSSIIKQFFQQQDLRLVSTDRLTPSDSHQWYRPDIQPEDIAFLQYTSGSTGEPKGVMLSHRNILHNSASIYRLFKHSSQSLGLSWLSPYDSMGLIGNIMQPLYGGFLGTLFPPTSFLRNPLCWLQAISDYRITTSGGPNFAYDLCVQKVKPEDLKSLDLSSWTVAFNGAETVRPQTLERFSETFSGCGFRPVAFHGCYGLTESTLMLSGRKSTQHLVSHHFDSDALKQGKAIVGKKTDHGNRTLVSCGESQADETVIIVDPQSKEPCPDGTVGEIWLASPSVALGYWGQAKQTEAIFKAQTKGAAKGVAREASEEFAKGPFLRTGDLGFLYQQELYVTGRLGDLITLRGEDYYPQEIESTAEQSYPNLAAGAGAAFSVTDAQGQNHLVVVQEVARACEEQLDYKAAISAMSKAIAQECNLPVYAISLLRPGAVPKTSDGKICRRASRFAFLSGHLPVIDDWSENPRLRHQFQILQSDVNQLLAQLSNVDAFTK